MPGYTIVTTNGELMHYGVMGMKWGKRKYQNPDGSLTAEGRNRYNAGSVKGNIARAVMNTALGQRIGVRTNRGYRADKKEIKALYKKKLKEGKIDKSKLKYDYKKTLGEARVDAAKALYGGSRKAHNITQNEGLGKTFAKSYLMGGTGALAYNRARAGGAKRGSAALRGVGRGIADGLTGGMLSVYDYATRRPSSKKKKK